MMSYLDQIAAVLESAARCKQAYFWTPGKTAADRRRREAAISVPEVSWTEGGHEYTARFSYSESCHHVYAYGTYTRDGNKTTITAIRNSYARLRAEEVLR